jgi:hypothetical protein
MAPTSAYDVDLPYRRLGRCRTSEPVAVALGTRLDQVAAALSTYETRNGRAATESQLPGSGVDLGAAGRARAAASVRARPAASGAAGAATISRASARAARR